MDNLKNKLFNIKNLDRALNFINKFDANDINKEVIDYLNKLAIKVESPTPQDFVYLREMK